MAKAKRLTVREALLKKLKKNGGGKHQVPRVVVKDAQGVSIALDGDDQGTRERHAKGRAFDPDQKIIGALCEIVPDYAVMDGKIARVSRSQDSLDLMKRNKNISDDEFNAGRRFQAYFEMAGKMNIGGIDFDKVGGGSSREEFMDIKLAAKQKLEGCYDVLGGEASASSLALRRIVGEGYSINQMIKHHRHPAHYWRGALVSGLQVLCSHFDPRKKKNIGVEGKSEVKTEG